MNEADAVEPVSTPTRVLVGRMAAPGFAAGPLVRIDTVGDAKTARATGTPTDERVAFDAAVQVAREGLLELMHRLAGTDAADILEFQIALIEDDALTDPVFDAIAEGLSAEAAWTERIDAEIAGYLAADDDYFRTRAGDLQDLKERVLRGLTGIDAVVADLPDGAILVADDLTPSLFLEIPWREGHGIALIGGSPTAHVAILARGHGVPMLVGLGDVPAADGVTVLIDGEAETLTIAPDAEAYAVFERHRQTGLEEAEYAEQHIHEPAVTRAGDTVAVLINIGGPDDLADLVPEICDGIGLVRTEFLFHGRDLHGLPGEDEQVEAYGRILAWAAGRPVIIRTLDAGGDKPIAGYTLTGEANPFLGLRGVRLSLAHPEVFRVQLRALLRASAHGPLGIMVPMVTVPQEMDSVRTLLAEEAAALGAAGIALGRSSLGMMVEVPAAALALDLFDTDFVSIGSNDLTQYVMAAGRDAASVAALADPTAPALLRLIGSVVQVAADRRIKLSLCGDAGGDPHAIGALLGAGLRSLSMAPAMVARAKVLIRSWPEEA